MSWNQSGLCFFEAWWLSTAGRRADLSAVWMDHSHRCCAALAQFSKSDPSISCMCLCLRGKDGESNGQRASPGDRWRSLSLTQREQRKSAGIKHSRSHISWLCMYHSDRQNHNVPVSQHTVQTEYITMGICFYCCGYRSETVPVRFSSLIVLCILLTKISATIQFPTQSVYILATGVYVQFTYSLGSFYTQFWKFKIKETKEKMFLKSTAWKQAGNKGGCSTGMTEHQQGKQLLLMTGAKS